MALNFAPNFTEAEFRAASTIWNLRVRDQAAMMSWRLQRVRDRLAVDTGDPNGGAARLTHFAEARSNGGCHPEGMAVDLVPLRVTVGRWHRAAAELHDSHRRETGEFMWGELLDETVARGGAHIHATLPGCGEGPDGEPDIMRLTHYDDDGRPQWQAGAAPARVLVGLLLVLLFVLVVVATI